MSSERDQIASQCRAVAHMATALAEIHNDYARLCEAEIPEALLGIVGERTASFMELLGNMLEGMDAASDEDDWMTPVFAEAQRLWPTPVSSGAKAEDQS